jgi:hypothetical protein
VSKVSSQTVTDWEFPMLDSSGPLCTYMSRDMYSNCR